MSDWEKLIRSYFSFSSKEKRGMLVLTGILFLLLFVRIYKRHSPRQFSEVEIKELRLSETVYREKTKETKSAISQIQYAPIDPNQADSQELIRGGLSPKQAIALIHYREAGAHFSSKSDLKKLFWMNDKLYAKLKVQIRNAEQGTNWNKEEKQAKAENAISSYKSFETKYNINIIDSLELVKIKGIGPYTAMKVLRYRGWLGGYIDTSQFREIKGLREEQISLLKERMLIDKEKIKKININLADQSALTSHPYIRYKAKIIVRYRDQHGPFTDTSSLLNTKVIDHASLAKLLPYLEF